MPIQAFWRNDNVKHITSKCQNIEFVWIAKFMLTISAIGFSFFFGYQIIRNPRFGTEMRMYLFEIRFISSIAL